LGFWRGCSPLEFFGQLGDRVFSWVAWRWKLLGGWGFFFFKKKKKKKIAIFTLKAMGFFGGVKNG
jgi:hypothetical protein